MTRYSSHHFFFWLFFSLNRFFTKWSWWPPGKFDGIFWLKKKKRLNWLEKTERQKEMKMEKWPRCENLSLVTTRNGKNYQLMKQKKRKRKGKRGRGNGARHHWCAPILWMPHPNWTTTWSQYPAHLSTQHSLVPSTSQNPAHLRTQHISEPSTAQYPAQLKRAEGKEQRVKSRGQRAEGKEQRVKSRG